MDVLTNQLFPPTVDSLVWVEFRLQNLNHLGVKADQADEKCCWLWSALS